MRSKCFLSLFRKLDGYLKVIMARTGLDSGSICSEISLRLPLKYPFLGSHGKGMASRWEWQRYSYDLQHVLTAFVGSIVVTWSIYHSLLLTWGFDPAKHECEKWLDNIRFHSVKLQFSGFFDWVVQIQIKLRQQFWISSLQFQIIKIIILPLQRLDNHYSWQPYRYKISVQSLTLEWSNSVLSTFS